MRGRVLFIAGLAVGYVLGTKAGRERYEQIAGAANRVWTNPNVQRGVEQVEDFVKDHAPDVAGLAADGVKKVASVARSAQKGASAKGASSTRTTRSSGTRSSGSRSTGTRSSGSRSSGSLSTTRKPSSSSDDS